MRVVPVIDLKAGTAVHAVRGDRERYRPVRSVFAGDDGDPLSLARAFRSELGLDELYVADLDAIGGEGEHSAGIGALAREARVMVDAGVNEPERALALLDLGARRVVVGTETLTGSDALDRLLGELPESAVVEDLRALGDAGAAGALVATALHGGVIGRRELAELG
jgi:phosphoribosylformimino-5-aminoimidazole carboxamide ribotide isomerase